MTDSADLDSRLAALLAYPAPATSDAAFAERVVALAAHDLRVRRARRRALAQVAREALALAAIVAAFVMLARSGPAAGPADQLVMGSPAMLGLTILLIWALVASRGPHQQTR